MTIGERIKYLRETNNLTQTDVARALEIATQTIFKYEKNIVTNIPNENIEKLANLFNVTPAYLMGWEDYSFQLKETTEREIEKRKAMSPIEDSSIRLEKAMKHRNVGTLELSKKTGISENILSRYLSGHTCPNEDNIYLLGRTLEVSKDWLMGYDVPMEAKYYSKIYELSAEEECIITIFRSLNKAAQARLLEYTMELNEISKYKK